MNETFWKLFTNFNHIFFGILNFRSFILGHIVELSEMNGLISHLVIRKAAQRPEDYYIVIFKIIYFAFGTSISESLYYNILKTKNNCFVNLYI